MTTRREVMKSGAAMVATLVPAGLAISAARSAEAAQVRAAAIEAAYRNAYAEFEAAVRPVSEVYWASHNRAVADAHAREAAARAISAAA